MITRRGTGRWACVATLLVGMGFGMASQAKADAVLEGEKFTDKIKFSGDMRLRHEAFYSKSTGATAVNSGRDRYRQRMRLRFGVTANLQDVTVGFRIASGVGEQVSTNQTYQNVFNQKGLFIDQAYLSWKAMEWVKLTGGKMPNPIWRTYASDMVWDDDINPEGYAQQYTVGLGDRADLFVNMGQFVLNEAGALSDPWMLANQLGSNLKLTEDTRLSMAGSYYGFLNEKAGDFITAGAPAAAGVRQYGNTRVGTTAQLATSLQLFHFTGELASHVGSLPISLQGDWIHNAMDTPANGSVGYQTGLVLGKAKAAKTWEVAYFRKYVQNNATYADIADSDFGYSGNGGGGTNRKGHIFWIAYAPREYVTLKAKYFITDVLNPYINQFGQNTTTFSPNSVNRFQLDAVVKF